MNNLRKASLVLKTSDLTPNQNNQFGFTDSLRTTATWNNINLRTILGDMYDQYDYFNISLNSIATGLAGAISTDRNNLSLYVRMSGLAWSNCSYNVKTGSNSQYAIIAPFSFIASATIFTLYSNNILTFGKNSDVTSITIDLMRIIDDSSSIPTTTYPNHVYLFDIVGVPKTLYLKNN
jgi:hypothetical protein